MPAAKKNPETLTLSQVLQRPGWTRRLVRNLLGEPDERKKVFGYSIPLSLYAIRRVEEAETSERFRSEQGRIAQRRAAARRGVQTKEERLLAEIARMPVSVRRIKNVEKQAIFSYNEWQMSRDSDLWADASASREFLDRIAVNFIRHELTEYDAALEEVAGRTGIAKGVQAIREKVFGRIAQVYPEYSDECRRQLQARSEFPP